MEGKPHVEPRPQYIKQRTCIRCNQTFESLSPGNRICPTCTRRSPRKSKGLQPNGSTYKRNGRTGST